MIDRIKRLFLGEQPPALDLAHGSNSVEALAGLMHLLDVIEFRVADADNAEVYDLARCRFNILRSCGFKIPDQGVPDPGLSKIH